MRCPYHANVMKMLDAVRRRIDCKTVGNVNMENKIEDWMERKQCFVWSDFRRGEGD